MERNTQSEAQSYAQEGKYHLQGVAYAYLFLLPSAAALLFFSFSLAEVDGRYKVAIDPGKIPDKVIELCLGASGLGFLSRLFPGFAGKVLPDSKTLESVGKEILASYLSQKESEDKSLRNIEKGGDKADTGEQEESG